MSKTYKHQATYDYLHNNKEVKGKLLKGIKKFFMNVNFPRWDDCIRFPVYVLFSNNIIYDK